MEFSKELINKAKACRTAEELLALAKENEIELTREDAEVILGEFKEGEVSDGELDNVAGGAEGCKPPNPYENVYWDKEEDVQFIFNVGDLVEAFAAACEHHTATCKVTNRRAKQFRVYSCSPSPGGSGWLRYADEYYLEKQPGVRSKFIDGWYQRSYIEK